MEYYTVRAMEIWRSLPDEIEQLHRHEVTDRKGVGYDPSTQTVSGFERRSPRCLMPFEIQSVFNRPPLKAYFEWPHNNEDMAGFASRCEAHVVQVVGDALDMMHEQCVNCRYFRTFFNGLWVDGEEDDHGDRCYYQKPLQVDVKEDKLAVSGEEGHNTGRKAHVTRVPVVNKRGMMHALITPVRVPPVHIFDAAVVRLRSQLNFYGEKKAPRGSRGRLLKKAAEESQQEENQ